MNNIGKQYPEHISLDEIINSDSLVNRLVDEERQAFCAVHPTKEGVFDKL